MIQCISNAMETNHSPQCQLPTGKSRCYISILTRNAFVHNCTMHNALHHCTIAQFQCTTRFQCTTDCVVKKTCYAICGKHLVLNVGMWGWFKADQLKYDHVAARKAWPQPLKSSINAPPTQTSLAIICLWPTYMITHIWPMVQPNKIPQNSYIYLLIPHCLHQFCHLVDIKDIDPLRYYH